MSDYITPDKVVSPRKNWQLIRVLETGEQPDRYGHRVAVAIGTWREGDEDPVVALAIRWNGDDERPIGSPQSRGLSVWFIVPGRFRDAIIDTLSKSLSKEDLILVKGLFRDAKK